MSTAKRQKEAKQALVWKAVSLAMGAAAGALVEQVLSRVWRQTASQEPPTNPADRRRSWNEALLWGAAIGLGAGVARVVANRSAAVVWEAATNETPPGVPS
jgi:hypothetical protein